MLPVGGRCQRGPPPRGAPPPLDPGLARVHTAALITEDRSMRLAPLLSVTALALLAAAAAAQDAAPPQGNGLSGLSDTLNGLSDDNVQAEAPPPAPAEANAH